MVVERLCPTLQRDYAACARTYSLDLAAALLLFVGASIMAGRVWRFAFDDELLLAIVVERSQSVFDFTAYFLRGSALDPPLAFLAFYGLLRLGFADWGIRLCSLAMTGLALALFQILCLTLITQRTGAAVRPATRLIAILLFGLCPMAIGQGDAMRWYPPFAALFAYCGKITSSSCSWTRDWRPMRRSSAGGSAGVPGRCSPPSTSISSATSVSRARKY
jgi:hypothetical protein